MFLYLHFSLFRKGDDEKSFVKYDELDEAGEDLDTHSRWVRNCDRYCRCPCGCAKRYTIAIVSSIGFLISFGIRCNMGVAIIQMTSNRTNSHFSREHPESVSEVLLYLFLYIRLIDTHNCSWFYVTFEFHRMLF